MNFWKTAYPFNDFVLSTTKNTQIDKKEIRKKLADNGLNYCKEDEEVGYFLASGIGLYNNALFSGVGQYNGTFYFGQHDLGGNDLDLESLNNSVGIFTSLYIRNGCVKISQDIFGCGILFYAQINGDLVVSNRYHLLLLFLSWIGFYGELDCTKVIASLCFYETFLHQNISEQMDIKGTYQLSFEKEILINKEGWHIQDKILVKELLRKTSKKSQQELLHDAKREITENIEAVFNSEQFSKYVVDLTGGFDSRAVFAAFINASIPMDQFEIRTYDVLGSRDLEIAAGIKNLFGGKWYRDTEKLQYPLTLSESKKMWRSYYMGTYYQMGLPSWSPKGENLNQIRFSGGCGEIYRKFWFNNYGKKVATATSIEDLSEKLVNSLHLLSSSDDVARKRLIELIAKELKKIPGNTPLEKFDNHYIFFRNRYHFGMRAFEYFHDAPMWFPLMSKSLFILAHNMPREDKDDKKVPYLLTKSLYPVLANIDFDTMPIQTKEKVILHTNSDAWKEVQMRNKEFLMTKRSGMDEVCSLQWRSIKQLTQDEIFSMFYELKKYNKEMNLLLDENMLNSIKKYMDKTSFMNTTYARLCSIKDQLDIFSKSSKDTDT